MTGLGRTASRLKNSANSGWAGGRSEMEGFPIICCDVAESSLWHRPSAFSKYRVEDRGEITG